MLHKIIFLMVLLLASPVFARDWTLTWADNSNNESNFRIERGTDSGGPFVEIDTVLKDVTTYKDLGLDDQVYCYRVQAYNIAKVSGYSNVACVSGPVNDPGALTISSTTTTTTTTSTTTVIVVPRRPIAQ